MNGLTHYSNGLTTPLCGLTTTTSNVASNYVQDGTTVHPVTGISGDRLVIVLIVLALISIIIIGRHRRWPLGLISYAAGSGKDQA